MIPCGKRILHGVLNGGIDRRINVIPARAELVFHGVTVRRRIGKAALLQKMRNDIVYRVLHKVRHIVHLLLLADLEDLYLLPQRAFILLLGNIAGLIHALQHLIGTVVRDLHFVTHIHVSARIIRIGRLRETREHCAFPHGEFGKLFAEIILGCGLYAVIRLTEVNVVQVRFQDLVFADHLFQFERKVRFLDLALIVALRAENLILDELLRDRAAAGGIGIAEDLECGGKQALEIHALMLVKTDVLHSDERILEHIGNVLDVHPVAVFDVRDRGHEFPVFIVQKRGAIRDRELRDVERRRGIDICLADTERESQPRKAEHDKRNDEQFQRGEQHGKGKRTVPFLLLKQTRCRSLCTEAHEAFFLRLFFGIRRPDKPIFQPREKTVSFRHAAQPPKLLRADDAAIPRNRIQNIIAYCFFAVCFSAKNS